MKRLLYVLLSALLLASCHRTAPQTPSNKVDNTDTVALSMVEMNQRLAAEADVETMRYVKNTGLNFVQEPIGSWMLRTQRTEQARVLKNEAVRVHMQVFALDSTLIEDVEETVSAGKKEAVPAVDMALVQLNHGERATLICPWYAAFGQTGTTTVKPYTNVRIELEIK